MKDEQSVAESLDLPMDDSINWEEDLNPDYTDFMVDNGEEEAPEEETEEVEEDVEESEVSEDDTEEDTDEEEDE